MPNTKSAFYLGLDLGKLADFSALCVVERRVPFYTQQENFHYGGTPPPLPPIQSIVRHLHRWPLQTAYPAIVRETKDLLERPELQRHSTLVIDATGVGVPVLDMFTEVQLSCPLYGVMIHGGDKVSREGLILRIPKRDLVFVVNKLLQSALLHIVPTLPEAEVLSTELTSFRMKIDPVTAHDAYSAWREQNHDDLVLAVALACWVAEKGPTPIVVTKYNA